MRTFTLCLVCALPVHVTLGEPAEHWTSFRGTHARGVADDKDAPTAWNVDEQKNITWMTPIPGLAHSSPVVWGDRIFVTTAVSENPDPLLRVGLYGESPDHPENVDHEFRVYCLDKSDGKVLWQKTAHKGVPTIKRHIKATHANCTPATDGKHVVAFFGSEGLYCFSVEGDLIWKKNLGLLDGGPFGEEWREIQWGVSSSPVIYDGAVVVQCDTRSQKFLAAFNVHDGSERWRTPRDDYPTFSTPTVHAGPERTQIIVNGFVNIGGYDFRDGRKLWRLSGGGDVPTPTPIVADDLIYITNAHGGMAPIYAVRTDATGDISLEDGKSSNSFVAWSKKRAGNYMQTPIVYDDYFYSCKDNGVMSCYRAATGEKIYRKRLGNGSTGFTASPVAANGKLYFTSEEGDVHVIKSGPEFELLAVNPMGEVCMATPAISDGRLFFRTRSRLVAVGKK